MLPKNAIIEELKQNYGYTEEAAEALFETYLNKGRVEDLSDLLLSKLSLNRRT